MEVCNTDAEGRLILADAMAYLQKKYELESLVDICTLTGAICVGLGEYTSGLFVNNDEMAESLIAAGNEVQERCWRMPIEEEHEAEIKSSTVADLRSMGVGREGRVHGCCVLAPVREGRLAVGALGHCWNGNEDESDGLDSSWRHWLRRAVVDGVAVESLLEEMACLLNKERTGTDRRYSSWSTRRPSATTTTASVSTWASLLSPPSPPLEVSPRALEAFPS